MDKYKRTAGIVGVLFVLGTVSGILSGAVLGPITTGPAYPLNIVSSETQWILGTLLILMMGFPLAMIPVFLFPILRKQNEVLAVAAIVFRGVFEAVCYMGIVISNFLLLTLSQAAASATVDSNSMQTLAVTLTAVGDWTSLILGLVFSIGGMMIYQLFYQTGLVPRWLSGWGFIGAILYFLAHLEGIFGAQQVLSFGSGLGFLMIPLAVQEMVLAVWLIVKGFKHQVFPAHVAANIEGELLVHRS